MHLEELKGICHLMYKLLYPSIGPGQRLLYRLGSGLGFVSVSFSFAVLHVSRGLLR